MNNIKLTKSSIILTILFVVSVVMLPIEYFWGRTGVELLELEKNYLMMPGLLLWVLLVAQLAAAVLGILNRYDLAFFSSVIGVCCAVFALLLRIIDYGDGNFMEHMGTGIVYCVIAIIEVFICINKKKTIN